MGDMGDLYREHRKYSQAKRAGNRQSSTQLLIDEGIGFAYKNNGAHLIIDTYQPEDQEAPLPIGPYDFWPGTGLWIERQTQLKGRGVQNLIRQIKEEK